MEALGIPGVIIPIFQYWSPRASPILLWHEKNQIRHTMKMLKTFACLLLATTVTAAAVAKDKKSGRRKAVVETAAKDTTVDSLRNKSRKPYESVITPDAETVRGLVTLHKVKSKYYMELPYSVMDAQMLLAARVSGISNNRDIIAGRMPHDPLLIRWSADDDKVYLHTVDCSAVCDSAGIRSIP